MNLSTLIESTKGMSAVEFDSFINTQKVSNEWLEVTLTNLNDGVYNVYLNDFDVCAYSFNGSPIEIG